MVQGLFDKTKWLAFNVENLPHEPLDADLPSVAQCAGYDLAHSLFN